MLGEASKTMAGLRLWPSILSYVSYRTLAIFCDCIWYILRTMDFYVKIQNPAVDFSLVRKKAIAQMKNLNRVSRKTKSVVCSSVDLLILVRNLSTDLDFLKLPCMLLFCILDLQ